MREDSRYPMRHGSVLFVGIGGGNDIFSTVLATSALRHLGWTWERSAIAGVLSPFRDHDVIVTGARCLRVIHPYSKRYIPTKEDEPERRVTFVDAAVSRLAREASVVCDRVYGLDLRAGSVGLTKTFQRLALAYDMIVLVDIGGDCLYRGASDKRVLTPMFDALTLRAFVDAKVPGFLFLAGPGTDGEIDPESLRHSIYDTGAEPHALPAAAVRKMEILHGEYIRPVRPGQTTGTLLRAFRAYEPEIEIRPAPRQSVGRTTFTISPVGAHRINTAMCRSYYLIDPRKIRNPFMVRCKDTQEWFVKTQLKQGHTTSEADLEYLRVGDEIWRFATPSPLFAPDFRRMMVSALLDELRKGTDCDGLWLLPEDWMALGPERILELSSTLENGLIAVRRPA